MTNPLYNHTSGVPAAQSRGISSSVRTEFDLVQAGFDNAADKRGDTYSGTHDMTAATLRVKTPVVGGDAVNKTYADSLAMNAALPVSGSVNKGQEITNDGTIPQWGMSAYSAAAISNYFGN